MKQLRGALAALGVLVGIWAILATVGYFTDAFPGMGGDVSTSEGSEDGGVATDAGAAHAHGGDAAHPHDGGAATTAHAGAVDAGAHGATPPPTASGDGAHPAAVDAGSHATDAGAAMVAATPAPARATVARWRLCDGDTTSASLVTLAVTGDARPELAVVCDRTARVLVLDTTGGAVVPRRVLSVGVPDGTGALPVVSAITATDVDGDTRADLAIGLAPGPGGGAGGLVLLPRDATGGFARARSLAPIAVADLVAAPLDARDGSELVALTARSPLDARPSEVWIFGGANVTRTALLRGPRGGALLAVADLDGDAHLDVLAASAGDADAVVWLGDGHAFPRTETVAAHGVRSAIAGDLDRDGEADVVLGGDHAVLVRRAPPAAPDADGGRPHVLDLVALDVASGVRHLVAADVDAAPGTELVGYAPPSLVVVRHVAGDAGPLALERHELRAFHDGDPVPVAIAAADLDGDGAVDLAFLGRTADGAAVELVIVRDVGGFATAAFADHADPVGDAPLTLNLSVR